MDNFDAETLALIEELCRPYDDILAVGADDLPDDNDPAPKGQWGLDRELL
jgi:hypothetical protein